MTQLKHNNLFASGDRKKEVYAALQRDFNRDTHIHGLWHAGILLSAAGAAYFTNRPECLWLFGGLYAAERSISKFIEMSNRNWAMHVIDWIENSDHGQSS